MPDDVIRSVGDLISALEKLDPNLVPCSLEPPFDGVRLVVQDPHDGVVKVLISCPPRDKYWSRLKPPKSKRKKK